MTMGHAKAHGVALAWCEWCKVKEATSSRTTGTTPSRGALDSTSKQLSRSLGHKGRSWEVSWSSHSPLRAWNGGEAHWSRDHAHHHEPWCPSRPVELGVVPDGCL
uniref:Uncharacterized protein n=1 Tax=Solanum tuberosum TaxID=4113 RepID=M1DMF9_SOLTU